MRAWSSFPAPYVLTLALALCPVPGTTEEGAPLRGTVRDGTGGAVAGAEVRFETDGAGDRRAASTADGTFTMAPTPTTPGRFRIRAPGFAPVEQAWSPERGSVLEIVLTRLERSEEVTVTASRVETAIGETAARVVLLGRDAVRENPAVALDDVLRQVPGFSLFRRSGSRVANPTAQGASLRGVGPSGASRTLVLLDGVPLNDPFGGWVYWSRVPRAAVDRIEILEGGASDLYGSAALGGVIQVLTRSDAPAFVVEVSAGGARTGTTSLYGAWMLRSVTVRASAEALTTDGYGLVDDAQAGPVDTAAASRHLVGSLALDLPVGTRGRAFLRAAAFGESRDNGTPLQVNDTDWQEAVGGGDWWSPAAGHFSLRAWHSDQSYRQTFTAVAPGRATEALTRSQRVPANASGVGMQWTRALGRHALVAGIDARRVTGRSEETVWSGGRATSFIDAGGDERVVALFASDRVALGNRTIATAGLRVDHWREANGSTVTTPAGGIGATTPYPDRDETRVSPRASILVRVTPGLRLTAAGYGAFRAPTLNELYRSFRVGDTLTRANPALTEERLAGVEAGAAWSGAAERLRLRAVAFWAQVDDPVANVTLTTTPALVTRERRNLGRALSRGVTLESEMRVGAHGRVAAGYTFSDAVVRRFAPNPAIEGKEIPQVPRHQATLEAHFRHPRLFSVMVQARASSAQFEDDLNDLTLPGYVTVDARLARRISGRIEVFAAAENLTGDRYAVGLTPLRTLGPPRLWRLGLRIDR